MFFIYMSNLFNINGVSICWFILQMLLTVMASRKHSPGLGVNPDLPTEAGLQLLQPSPVASRHRWETGTGNHNCELN